MEFYDLLKEAAKNKQKSEKELEGNRRYNLNFKPMKKISRPKVNKAAIEAQIKKKEEEQRRKAEQEEKERQRVLALRAEQEAAKSSKKRRDSSSGPSNSTRGEKSTIKKKAAKQDGHKEDTLEKRKTNNSFPKEEKFKDFRLSSKQGEEQRPKSKSGTSKPLPDAKPKAAAPSFKELMSIAASNAGTSKPFPNGLDKHIEQSQPNVKLKGKTDSRVEKVKSDSGKSFRQGKSQPKDESTANIRQSSHRESPLPTRAHAGSNAKKPTLFPNTKGNHKLENSREPRSHEKNQRMLSGKPTKSSVHSTEVKRASGSSSSKVMQKVSINDKMKQGGVVKSAQHPVKRKGGWLDPVTDHKRKPEDMRVKNIGNMKQIVGPHEKKKSTVAGTERQKEKKGGWLDPVPRTSARDEVTRAEARGKVPVRVAPTESKMKKPAVGDSPSVSKVKKTPLVPVNGKKRGWLDVEVTPKSSSSVKERKGGWLDPPSVPRERKGGWLGPIRDPSASRSGGWLGPIREPSVTVKRGRLLSSEDEEEDSDMDGFIDDTPLEESGGKDISSYIKEIFGYDKSTYKNESDYALKSMEASYSQILKEEARSARIAQQEDAEEWRKEKEREKKKLAAKAKRK